VRFDGAPTSRSRRPSESAFTTPRSRPVVTTPSRGALACWRARSLVLPDPERRLHAVDSEDQHMFDSLCRDCSPVSWTPTKALGNCARTVQTARESASESDPVGHTCGVIKLSFAPYPSAR
jgi:hypothetical protein